MIATPPRARAFTTLELVLALAVASIVMLGAVATLTGVQRADERLTIRADEQAGVGRAQIIIRRALASLAMSISRGNVDDGNAAVREDFRFGLIPRVALDADPLVPGAQRLMLAVHRPPADESLAAALYTSSETLDRFAAVTALGANIQPEYNVGAFVLRPERRDDLAIFGADTPEITYTLWWVPDLDAAAIHPPAIPLATESTGSSDDPSNDSNDNQTPDTPTPVGAETESGTEAESPAPFTTEAGLQRTRLALREPATAGGVPICRGLISCRWRFYHRRAFKERMLIARADDLPAFIELELETATGVYANWLFEVDYVAVGDDALPTPDTQPSDENETDGEANDDDADAAEPFGGADTEGGPV
ncbi:MAG: hypothetical protein AAGK04_03470 [Planctomycetota bacterium]